MSGVSSGSSSQVAPVVQVEGAAACGPSALTAGELLELVNAGSDWIWETDADLRFSWLSENYETVTGVAPDQVLGRFRFDFLQQTTAGGRSATAHLEDLEARRPFRDFIYRVRNGRDDCRWISITGYPRYGEGGAFLGYRGIGRKAKVEVDASGEAGPIQGRAAPSPGQVRVTGPHLAGNSHAERMMAALDVMSDAFCYYDQDDRIVLYNEALVTIYRGLSDIIRPGLAFREFLDAGLARGYWDTGELSDGAWREAMLAKRREQGQWQCMLRFADGRTVVHREVGTGDGGTIATCSDITELENRQVALAKAGEEAGRMLSDLQRTLDSMNMGVVLVDGGLKAEIINKAFYEIWKLSPSDVAVGSPFRALMDINRHNGIYDVPDHAWEGYVASRLAEIRAGDVAPREFRRADGCTMIYSVTALSGGKRLISYYDISEMKEREAKLAAALERSKLAQSVINSVKDPIFVKDHDLRFVLANEAFAAMFGRTPEEMLGRLGGEFLADGASAFEESERRVLATGERYEVEEDFEFQGIGRSRLVRKHRVRMDSGRSYVACVVFDVTEMKRRETEAEAARKHLANVLDSLPAGVIIYDSNDEFVFANRMLQDSLPLLRPAWVVGKPLREALALGHQAGYFRSSGDPEVDALYEADRGAWLDGMQSRYRQSHSVFERRNEDGRWFKVFDKRADDGTFIGVRVDITETKRRETEAEEARQRLAEVMESLPAGVIIYDRDDRFVLANRKLKDAVPALAPFWVPGTPLAAILRASHAAGYDRDSGDPEVDALYDTDMEAWVEAFGAKFQTRHQVSERRYPDGRWFQVINTRTEDGTFIGVRSDISELKERERALKKSMRKIELFRHVLDELPVATFVKSSDLTIEYVNKAWCELTGISKAQAVGKGDRDFFGAEGVGFASRDAVVIATGVTDETEEVLTHRDGTPRQLIARKSRLVASDGKVHLIGSSTDVTDIKERERRLQESQRDNEIFRSLIDNVPVAIYAKREDLKLFYVNKYWSQLTGLPAEQALGRTDYEVSGESGLAFMGADREILRSGQSLEFEETVEDADGSLRYQVARKGSMVASDGTLFLLGSTIDVTEQKRKEQELREAQKKAVLADRAKSEFLANMSHEIRTPMNGVLGMAELLAKSELNPKQKTFTDIIVKSGNALLTIINDILDFSKIDAGQLVLDPAPFRLAEAIEDVATLISTRAKEKDLELIVRVAPGLSEFFVGDVGRIRQIVTNLIGNAVKFTDAGHVLVDVSGYPAGEHETKLRISVTDTGIGIPADKLAMVFDKFSQVDASSTRRHEGTGLGLAITSRLVTLMGGEIGVDSVEGEGSTFWFTVTLEKAGSSNDAPVAPVDVTGARILVVDDNPINRAILAEQMASWTFDSCAVDSGADGLKLLNAAAAMGVRVDCVVLDYQMPGMTGAEMARLVRTTGAIAHTPIVMLTSVDQSLSNGSFRDLGIDAQLTKPARSSMLLETLVATIQKHRSGQAVAAGEWTPAPRPQRSPSEPPRAIASASVAAEQITVGPRAPTQKHRVDILVAEDNEVNQLVFTQILGETEHSFQIVGNGRLAVQAVRDMQPRMILMDVSMPEMNGLEATGAIRRMEAESGGRVPIIGVTAHALKGDRERCLEAGMDDYLPKPISPRALLEKVERWTSPQAPAADAG